MQPTRFQPLGALAAFLLLLTALVAVPMSPAGADTRTRERCDYDPISGMNFNCRRVPVPHTHPTPSPITNPGPNPNMDPGPDPDEEQEDENENENDGQGSSDGAGLSNPPSATPDDEEQEDENENENDGQGSSDGTGLSNPPSATPDPDDEQEEDDDGSGSGRPGRCDTHPPQAGCNQQGSGSQSNQRDEHNSQNQQDTSTERNIAADAICTVAGQRDARIGLVCDGTSMIEPRAEWAGRKSERRSRRPR
ncbi:hypothetical protein [Candidatus Poriferisodalis sp.]|uniref:hypothetical protein n=1 Tax=Candidatus Poriferisodalis sp. TaxID=3101277 RepID=UPI003B5224D1